MSGVVIVVGGVVIIVGKAVLMGLVRALLDKLCRISEGLLKRYLERLGRRHTERPSRTKQIRRDDAHLIHSVPRTSGHQIDDGKVKAIQLTSSAENYRKGDDNAWAEEP